MTKTKEKDLKKAIGREYEEYQKEVPMLIPFTKSKKKELELKRS